MAARGRKPKAPELKVLHGDRADRINQDSPAAIAGRPECPEWLKEDPVASLKWDELVDQLEQLGVLSRTDSESIALYCATYSTWRMARSELKTAESLTVAGAQGGTKLNPLNSVVASTAGLLARLQAEFGLTPSSRSRVNAQGKKADELDQFLNSGKTH